MEKNPFLGRLMKDTTEDVTHSSAYGKAQNAGGMGAASTESFDVRREIDKNRKMVRGYGDSKVVNEVGNRVPRARRYEVKEEVAVADNKGEENLTLAERRNRGVLRKESAVADRVAKQGGMAGQKAGAGSRGENTAKMRAQIAERFGSSSLRGGSASKEGASTPPARRNPGIYR